MIDLQYPQPSYIERRKSKKQMFGFIIIAFLFGAAFGRFSYPNGPDPIIILDPIEIPQDEEIENELDTFTIQANGQEELNFSYWTEDKQWDLFIHTHNTTITEFYFDRDLQIVTNRSYTFVIHESFDLLWIISDGVVFVTFWFWKN